MSEALERRGDEPDGRWRIELSVRFEEDSCSVKVQDDGAGFDPEMVASLPAGHYGLIGIKERVSRIGGRLTLNSRTGVGTELIIQIPRTVAASSDTVPGASL